MFSVDAGPAEANRSRQNRPDAPPGPPLALVRIAAQAGPVWKCLKSGGIVPARGGECDPWVTGRCPPGQLRHPFSYWSPARPLPPPTRPLPAPRDRLAAAAARLLGDRFRAAAIEPLQPFGLIGEYRSSDRQQTGQRRTNDGFHCGPCPLRFGSVETAASRQPLSRLAPPNGTGAAAAIALRLGVNQGPGSARLRRTLPPGPARRVRSRPPGRDRGARRPRHPG